MANCQLSNPLLWLDLPNHMLFYSLSLFLTLSLSLFQQSNPRPKVNQVSIFILCVQCSSMPINMVLWISSSIFRMIVALNVDDGWIKICHLLLFWVFELLLNCFLLTILFRLNLLNEYKLFFSKRGKGPNQIIETRKIWTKIKKFPLKSIRLYCYQWNTWKYI